MGMLTNSTCYKCKRDRGDLIHLLYRCPKLHHYWTAVLDTLNRVFHIDTACWESYLISYQASHTRHIAFNHALFQACKLLFLLWKLSDPPSHRILKYMYANIGDAWESLRRYGHCGWIPLDSAYVNLCGSCNG